MVMILLNVAIHNFLSESERNCIPFNNYWKDNNGWLLPAVSGERWAGLDAQLSVEGTSFSVHKTYMMSRVPSFMDYLRLQRKVNRYKDLDTQQLCMRRYFIILLCLKENAFSRFEKIIEYSILFLCYYK